MHFITKFHNITPTRVFKLSDVDIERLSINLVVDEGINWASVVDHVYSFFPTPPFFSTEFDIFLFVSLFVFYSNCAALIDCFIKVGQSIDKFVFSKAARFRLVTF